MKQLKTVIREEYLKPFNHSHNSCLAKTLRISSAARGLGKKVRILFSIVLIPTKRWKNISIINPRFYLEIDGERIDVAFDPDTEKKYCKNNEVKILLPVNVSIIERPLKTLWNLYARCRGQDIIT